MHIGGALATIPPNIYSSGTIYELTMLPVPPPTKIYRSAGVSFQLRATAGTLLDTTSSFQIMADSPSIELVANANREYLNHLDINQIGLSRWDEISEEWIRLPSVYNADQSTVTAQTSTMGMFALQAPLICPADDTEPNDSSVTAVGLGIDDTASDYFFDMVGDEDWFAFQATAGEEYTLIVRSTEQGVALSSEVFAEDGQTHIQVDPVLKSWVATEDAVYYLHVRPESTSQIGCQSSYSITVAQVKKVYLPSVVR